MVSPEIQNLISGAVIAGVASLARSATRPKPKNAKPVPFHEALRMTVGKFVTSMIIGMAVSALASDWWNLSASMMYAACGVSGLIGENAVLNGVQSYLKRFGINIEEGDESEAVGVPEKKA